MRSISASPSQMKDIPICSSLLLLMQRASCPSLIHSKRSFPVAPSHTRVLS
jgi:hypothetical protein